MYLSDDQDDNRQSFGNRIRTYSRSLFTRHSGYEGI
jgi:hypothetical protein